MSDDQPVLLPSEPGAPAQLPVLADAVHVPPNHDPDLMPYAQWRQDQERGARAAHDDARLPPDERTSSQDVQAHGYAFWSGYTTQATELRNAGVIT